jgi:hypothetical protein
MDLVGLKSRLRRHLMLSKLIRHRFLAASIAGLGTAIIYIHFSEEFISMLLRRRDGDIPLQPSWWESPLDKFLQFPAGTIGLSSSILVVPILNALFWGAVASITVASILKGKVAAKPTAEST